MDYAQIRRRFPATVELFGSANSFHTRLHHSISSAQRVGSGGRATYTVEHIRCIALRRLLSNALGSVTLPRTINPALAAATFDHDQQTAMIVTDGCVITLPIPDNLWRELVSETRTRSTPVHA